MTGVFSQIGIVAGELSGDLLGGGLLQALVHLSPQIYSEGIGGPQMQAAGLHSLYPLETLSVMGLVEVLKHLPRLKRCRDHLHQHFRQHPPNVFIGIDSPDFNLSLEHNLKQAGIPTIHYVSPSVWAWRQYRIRTIAQACDLMLTLFPFEAQFYQQHRIPVKYVGHPLADEIPLHTDPQVARKTLNLPILGTYIALLPGSRHTELRKLTLPFLHTARWLLNQSPQLHFLLPLASPHLKPLLMQQVSKMGADFPLTILTGQSHLAMAAADVILTASGTATLEAMLFKRPMVVAYRLAEPTYWLAKWLVRTPYFSLPNLLAQQPLVPELLQHQVTPENLGKAILHWLDHPIQVEQLQNRFMELHQQLRQGANQRVAEAVFDLVESG